MDRECDRLCLGAIHNTASTPSNSPQAASPHQSHVRLAACPLSRNQSLSPTHTRRSHSIAHHGLTDDMARVLVKGLTNTGGGGGAGSKGAPSQLAELSVRGNFFGPSGAQTLWQGLVDTLPALESIEYVLCRHS